MCTGVDFFLELSILNLIHPYIGYIVSPGVNTITSLFVSLFVCLHNRVL